MKKYLNVLTGETITEKEFRQMAIDYINSQEWEDGGKPSISEVMLNMDDVIEIEEVEKC